MLIYKAGGTMNNLLNIYNEYCNTNYNKEEMNKSLNQMENKKSFYNNLIEYVDRYISYSFEEIKRIESNIPVKVLKKYNKIKKIPIFNKAMLNYKIKKYEEFSEELLHYIDETRLNKYYHKLIDLKKQTNDQRILELIHEEILNLNKIKNELYYRFDHLIIELDLKIIERKIKDSNNKKIVGFPSNNKKFKNNLVYNEKYNTYLKNPLFYFDVVKLEVVQQYLDERIEKEVLEYIDSLKKEFIYLFKYSLNPNDNNMVIRMLMSLDFLVENKLDNYGKQYVKKVS